MLLGLEYKCKHRIIEHTPLHACTHLEHVSTVGLWVRIRAEYVQHDMIRNFNKTFAVPTKTDRTIRLLNQQTLHSYVPLSVYTAEALSIE